MTETIAQPPTTSSEATNTQPGPASHNDSKSISTSTTKSKPKSKSKSRARARPRRRGSASGSEDEDPADAHSDGSLTPASSSDEAEDDEDEDGEVEVEGLIKRKDSSDSSVPAKSTFIDPSASLPIPSGSGAQTEVVEMTFDEFNKNGGEVRGKQGKARGGGLSTESRPKREFTEEELKRKAEANERKKERQKARKKEIQELKRLEREAKEGKTVTSGAGDASTPKIETSSAPKGEIAIKGKAAKKAKKNDQKSTQPNIDALTASTSALTVSDPQPEASSSTSTLPPNKPAPSNSKQPQPSKVNNREAYTQKIATDVKFTPRVGGFWTHDHRLYEDGSIGEGGLAGMREMSGFWRGRGLPPRGGMMDRARGFRGMRGGGRGGRGFPNGQQFGFRGAPPHMGAQDRTGHQEEEKGPKMTEMDKLELELERQDRERKAVKAAQLAREEALAQAKSSEPTPEDPTPKESTSTPAPIETLPPPFVASDSLAPQSRLKENKWGHEAFEQITKVEEQFAQNRFGRGRGRGRGFGFIARSNLPFHPANRHNLPTPDSTPGSTPTVNLPFVPHTTQSQVARPSHPSKANENVSTQPTVDELLGENDSVRVKLPGSSEEVSEPQPAQGPTPPDSHADASTASATVDAVPNGHVEPSTSNQAYPTLTGSDHGSNSSNFVPVPVAMQPVLPQGIGMGPSGEYYNLATGAPVPFRPTNIAPQNGYPSPNRFYRQYYPNQEPQPQYHHLQNHSQRNSFSGPAPSPPPVLGYSQDPRMVNGNNGGGGSPYGMNGGVYLQNQMTGGSAGSGIGGYFVPARSSKVSIRPPPVNPTPDDPNSESSNDNKSNGNANGNGGEYVQLDQSNPNSGYVDPRQQQQHQQGQNGYYAQHYNPYAQSMEGQEMYYPTPNGYGWGQQQQQQQQAQMGGGLGQGYGMGYGYGYEGEYNGY